MKEYWEITYERGMQTLAVWYLDSAFEITGTTMAQHQTRVTSLQDLADTRTAAELSLSNAREAARDLFAELADLNVRLPGSLDGILADDDDLHGQLDLIYAVPLNVSEAQTLRRARRVKGLWTAYNARLAALTPPKPALTIDYQQAGSINPPETVALADFEGLIDDALAAQTTDEDRQREVSTAKSNLRATERRVDRDNKRWYKAWTKKFPEGTVKGDAARSQITTEHGTLEPTPLPIESAVLQSGSGNQVLVTFSSGGLHATTKELLYKLPADNDYGHTVPITGATMTAGPFTGGQTVSFRTRVSNSHPGVVWGDPVAVAIP